MSAAPRPDKQAETAIARLRHTPEIRAYTDYLRQRLAYYQSLLVTAGLDAVPSLQGRAQELKSIIDTLTKDPS